MFVAQWKYDILTFIRWKGKFCPVWARPGRLETKITLAVGGCIVIDRPDNIG
jgi:hypothetical protein